MGFPFSQHLTVFFCIVPSDYKRFVRFQWKDNNRICYFSEKNPYSYALKIKEKKKKKLFQKSILFPNTLHPKPLSLHTPYCFWNIDLCCFMDYQMQDRWWQRPPPRALPGPSFLSTSEASPAFDITEKAFSVHFPSPFSQWDVAQRRSK